MCGHHPKSLEIRAWSANVDAGCPVLLMSRVVVVDALILNAIRAKAVVAKQEVTEPPVVEVFSSVPKSMGGDPASRGVGMISPAPEVVATVVVGVVTPIITGIPTRR